MIDYRMETFLTLCKLGSYTKTAERLSLTQPAVSQHIKHLEDYYGAKLFDYKGRVLALTERGKLLYDFAVSMKAGADRVREMMRQDELLPLSFGATLTVGEYIMPPVIEALLGEMPNLHLAMRVNNTSVLLQKLRDGQVDFVILEGNFDKSRFDSRVFSREPFIAVCSPNNPLAGRRAAFCELTSQRLLVREPGSGTRDILEHILYEYSLTIDNFRQVIELGNLGAIKHVAEHDKGITFLYRAAVERELREGRLCEVLIEDFYPFREINFVFLKESLHKGEYIRWFDLFLEMRRRQQTGQPRIPEMETAAVLPNNCVSREDLP